MGWRSVNLLPGKVKCLPSAPHASVKTCTRLFVRAKGRRGTARRPAHLPFLGPPGYGAAGALAARPAPHRQARPAGVAGVAAS